MTAEECINILKEGKTCTLALAGDDGHPYSLPINYAYAEGKIYFHCAPSGHKLDAIKRCNKASLCVIASDDVVEEKFTSYFKSVIAFGRMHILSDKKQKVDALRLLAQKYCPHESPESTQKEIERFLDKVCILMFEPEYISGKQAIELT